VERLEVAGHTEVIVGRGVLDASTVLGDREGRRIAAVFTQPSVATGARRLAAEIDGAGLQTGVRVLPDGEEAKTLAEAEACYRWLGDLGVTRGDTVVAMGGGALTDAAGFVAATYLRGLESIYVPTTLLGAVDASLGGKTAVNLEAKNLVGVFHHPARVVVDADLLDALPVALKREGAAEAVKVGCIGDPGLLDLFEQDGVEADLEAVVHRALAVKAGVVERDPLERGERAHLNYGHTVGHAVEVVCGLRHGVAVAVGMVAAGRASARVLGFTGEERQRDLIGHLGLPVAAPGADAGAVRELVGRDKKRDATGLRMVLLEAFGAPRVEHVGSATVEAALEAIGVS